MPMILALLARLPWLRWAIPALIVIAVVVLVARCSAVEKADDAANREIGATVQREGDQRKTIENIGAGNAARTEIQEAIARDDGRNAAVHAECLRSARTPANCARYAVPK